MAARAGMGAPTLPHSPHTWQVEMEKKMLLERKRREDAERRQQQEEMERILEENKRKVGAAQGAGWGTAGMAGGLL